VSFIKNVILIFNCIVVFIYLQILILQMSNNENWFRSRHFAYCFSSQVGKYKYVLIRCRVIANLKINIMLRHCSLKHLFQGSKHTVPVFTIEMIKFGKMGISVKF
jgi:hypothetical protein